VKQPLSGWALLLILSGLIMVGLAVVMVAVMVPP
jgi:hypothetical protein